MPDALAQPTPHDEPADGHERARKQGDDRDQTANDRDHTSDAFDEASTDRDERADARDARAETREDAAARLDPGAASDRAAARRDRQGGANDRRHAHHDREAASRDRGLSARERDAFIVDALTGAHRREAGIVELEREILQAKRTKHSFVLVFVDVDGLKTKNDLKGHVAGDDLLREVISTIRGCIRPYDLIVRYGGDEFLCGLSDVALEEVVKRFALVNVNLASKRNASASAGMAELGADDSLEDLIRRADEALYEGRRSRRDAG